MSRIVVYDDDGNVVCDHVGTRFAIERLSDADGRLVFLMDSPKVTAMVTVDETVSTEEVTKSE